MHAQQRRLEAVQRHLLPHQTAQHSLEQALCRAPASHLHTKVAKAADAVALIPDSAVITVHLLPALSACRYTDAEAATFQNSTLVNLNACGRVIKCRMQDSLRATSQAETQ